MRFLMIMIPEVYGKPALPDFVPDQKAMRKMGEYNEQMQKAGILLALMVTVLLRLKASGILDEFPKLSAYVARGEARPAYKRAFAAQLAAFTAASTS